MLSGYLCSLCAFQWSHLWGFSPFVFRPGVAGLLTLAFFASVALQQAPPERRAATAIPTLVWLAITCWPLSLSNITATVLFCLLAVTLLALSLSPRRAVVGFFLTIPAAVVLWLPSAPLAATSALLVLLSGLEMLLLARLKPAAADSGPTAKQRLQEEAEARTAEIKWNGFSALCQVAAPGEGLRFTSTLLADTTAIIESCAGRRIQGSDLDGLYRFPNQASLDRCLLQLERYRRQVLGVLDGAQAPPLQLLISSGAGERPGRRKQEASVEKAATGFDARGAGGMSALP